MRVLLSGGLGCLLLLAAACGGGSGGGNGGGGGGGGGWPEEQRDALLVGCTISPHGMHGSIKSCGCVADELTRAFPSLRAYDDAVDAALKAHDDWPRQVYAAAGKCGATVLP
jgi:hypothetical protein